MGRLQRTRWCLFCLGTTAIRRKPPKTVAYRPARSYFGWLVVQTYRSLRLSIGILNGSIPAPSNTCHLSPSSFHPLGLPRSAGLDGRVPRGPGLGSRSSSARCAPPGAAPRRAGRPPSSVATRAARGSRPREVGAVEEGRASDMGAKGEWTPRSSS